MSPHQAPSSISLSCASLSSLNRFSTLSSPKMVAILFLALSSCSWSMCQRGVLGSCAMTVNSMMRDISTAMMGTLQAYLLSFPSVCVRITLRMNAMLRRGCWPGIFVRGLRRGRRLLAIRRNRQGQQHRRHLKQELVSIHPVIFCLWLHVRQILTNS